MAYENFQKIAIAVRSLENRLNAGSQYLHRMLCVGVIRGYLVVPDDVAEQRCSDTSSSMRLFTIEALIFIQIHFESLLPARDRQI